MSSTDAALTWLLSVDAACTSSPVPPSASPDFTDWLHISPTTDSPSTQPTSQPSSSPPFKDVTSSSKINLPQYEDFELNYLYHLPDFSNNDNSVTGTHNSVNLDSQIENNIPTSVAPSMFNRHHRMLSLESTSATTLINTPSPRSLAFFSPTGTFVLEGENRIASEFSPYLVSSPATKFMQELQRTTFGNYYHDFMAPSHISDTMSDISPVVRAEKLQESIIARNEPVNSKSKRKQKNRRNRDLLQPSFVEKLHAAPLPSKHSSNPPKSAPLALEPVSTLSELRRGSTEVTTLPSESILLSPCLLVQNQSPFSSDHDSSQTAIVCDSGLHEAVVSGVVDPLLASPPHDPTSVDNLLPLSPLTPISSSSGPTPPPKIFLKIKRKITDRSTPVRQSKRPRGVPLVESRTSPLTSTGPSSPENLPNSLRPVFTVRSLPDNIEISSNFPLFYRRFPASSYYQPDHLDSPCTLFGVSHPGGVYNPPRCGLDLYTPRFVKGKGVDKVGLCPICVEPRSRGGENKKIWFAMKFSAFNLLFLCHDRNILCAHRSYHMQYAHGISASTGRPFSPPTIFRTVARKNPGKKEKTSIQQGKCHECGNWIAVEGIKDMESKVKELHWWKHAAACHHGSTLEGEGDYYEEDDILSGIST